MSEEVKEKTEYNWETVEEDGKKVHISEAGNIVESNGVFYYMIPVGTIATLGPYDDLDKLKENVDNIQHDIKLYINKQVAEYNKDEVITKE